MPGLKMMIDPNVSWLAKMGTIILLPILLVFGIGVLLWWLVLQYWKAVVESIVFSVNDSGARKWRMELISGKDKYRA
jgi:hypothetical protein